MTTSSTWTSETPLPLVGCGIDTERPDRFRKVAAGEAEWPMLFSPEESALLRAQPDPALAFCASFCCKEALLKAVESTYSYTEARLLYRPGAEVQQPELSPGLMQRFGLSGVTMRFLDLREGEVTGVLFAFGPPLG